MESSSESESNAAGGGALLFRLEVRTAAGGGARRDRVLAGAVAGAAGGAVVGSAVEPDGVVCMGVGPEAGRSGVGAVAAAGAR